MITMAERRYPVRIRSGVPPGGFGQRHTEITAWLDQNYDADGWAITPSGVRGVLNMRCRSYSGRGLIVANTVHAPSVSILDPAHQRATNALASVASRK
jgi:hypothetical protein